MKNVKVVGYARVSTEEQAKEGISLEYQRAKIKQYAKLHNLDLLKIITDEGKSGKDLRREGIQEVISLCEEKVIGHIVVYKIDRLTRSTKDLLNVIEDIFIANEIKFHSISEKIDTSTAQGEFFLTIIGAMAQMERKTISERTKAVLQYKIGKGEYCGSPGLGFLASTGESKFLEVDEREQDTIRRIHYLKRYKHLSLGKIARELNESGVQTKRGGHWYSGTIKLILDRGEPKFKTNKLDINKEKVLV